MNQQPSSLFTPYKALGIVCSDVRPVYYSLPKEKRLGDVCAAVGNVFLTYRMQPFRRYKVSDPMNENITVLQKDKAFVFAASGKTIGVYKHNDTLVKLISIERDVKFMYSFVDILVVVDVKNYIQVIDVKSGEQILEMPSPPEFEATFIAHPSTYLNKIILGGKNGELRLINIKTGKLIHEFSPKHGFESPVTVIEQSTAVDIMAIGHENGRIQLRNLKTDQNICSFRQDGAITAISFRTDGVEAMASANSEGSIAMWDLEERILIGQRTYAHNDRITGLYFLRGLPYLFSAGADNRMVKWLVEDLHSMPEVNTQLAGHSDQVSALAFFDENALLSTSLDGHVRSYNLIRDDVMQHFGKTREVKKSEVSKDRYIDVDMGAIVELDVGFARESAWDNVICRHRDSPLVSTWTTRKKSKGDKLLYHDRFAKNPDYTTASATSLCLSACGNFAFIGYSTGHIDMFNVQSGIFRATFVMEDPSSTESVCKEHDVRAHRHPVTALVSDLCNQRLISGDSKGLIRFWSVNPAKCEMQCQLPAGVQRFKFNRLNSLLAVAANGGVLIIVDAISGKIARKWLKAHSDTLINAVEFSRDGNWLVSADNMGNVKVWDVTTSHLLDCMTCPSPCIALAFNPGGQFLVTAHRDERAVYVWANMPMFVDEFEMHVMNEESKATKSVTLPGVVADDVIQLDSDSDEEEDGCMKLVIDSETESEEEVMEIDDVNMVRRASNNLYAFSGLPPARWANLSELEAIKARNKPIEPPKKPKNAPFFLPTTESLEGIEFEKMDLSAVAEKERVIAAKRKLLELETPFAAQLLRASSELDYVEVFESLKRGSLSAIDFQIRSLSPAVMIAFINMLICMLERKKDVDLVQSYLNTFLRIHRSNFWDIAEDADIDECKELTSALKDIKDGVAVTANVLRNDVNENLAVLQWIKSAVIQIC